MILTVGISDMKISKSREDTLITYSLGSCVGITLYDPTHCIGGMLHALLPQAKMNPTRAQTTPGMFVDSGFEALLNSLLKAGADRKKLICKVAGGGSFLDEKGIFKTGERNYTMVRKVLWKNKILIKGEDVGGASPRTMLLYMENGDTALRVKGRESLL